MDFMGAVTATVADLATDAAATDAVATATVEADTATAVTDMPVVGLDMADVPATAVDDLDMVAGGPVTAVDGLGAR
jgi:hypothetical protein